ncbi:MAG TPA: hypothetical protein VF894_08165 [Anaeromyxobacter sp.]
MWTIVRFALLRDPDYRAAFDLLAQAGFQPHRTAGADRACAFPAGVVADLFQDPAVVTRAVFEGLLEAGLRPVGVSAAHVDVTTRHRDPAELAHG